MFDNCRQCNALDEEQSYLYWFDTVNCAMELNKKHKNMVRKNDLLEWMASMEATKSRLKSRYDLKMLPGFGYQK